MPRPALDLRRMRRLRLGFVLWNLALLGLTSVLTVRPPARAASASDGTSVGSHAPPPEVTPEPVPLVRRAPWAGPKPISSAARLQAVVPPLARPVEIRAPAWVPPAWFPDESRDHLWALTALDGPAEGVPRAPKVRARAAIVADLDRGAVLWSRRADEAFPVASLTKVVSALTLASTDPDLDQSLCLSWEQWPPRPGARSRFHTGSCHEGWEYVGAALVASDNRGAMAMATLSGLPFDVFVERMHEVSSDLGLGAARWADPTGLEDENMASARDLTKAIVALSEHPALAPAANATSWEIEGERGARELGTTNRLSTDPAFEVIAAKTGYTDTAGYCYAAVVRTRSGRTLALTVLGAPTNSARYADARALLRAAEG